MSRIFISYKREDKDRVFPLKDKIEAATGEKCWIDLDGIESDAQFANVIVKAIDESEIFLFMYSKRHAKIEDYERDWTVREINYAESERKRIVFVNIDGTPLTNWFKFMFSSKQQIDATLEDAFNHLLLDMNRWLGNDFSLENKQASIKPTESTLTLTIESLNLFKRINRSKRPKWQKVIFKTLIYIIGLIIILALAITFWVISVLSSSDLKKTNTSQNTTPFFAQRVIDAYPQFNIKFENNNLIFPDGTAILYDDKREKSFSGRLDSCDIEDMFTMVYDTLHSIPEYLNDCGRVRNEQLFKKMYGGNKNEVSKNLVSVSWFGKNISFTSVNGAAKQLEIVASELKRLPQYKEFLENASTFNWRTIENTNRLSSHSYGIAIDINTKYSNYWNWTYRHVDELDSIGYKNKIPIEIVRVFEKHGFIWGGRWYHYDTTHFEYRPELISN